MSVGNNQRRLVLHRKLVTFAFHSYLMKDGPNFNNVVNPDVDHLPVITFIVDTNGVFIVSEGNGLAKIGLHPGEMVGRSAFEIWGNHPNLIDDFHRALGGVHVSNETNFEGIFLTQSLFPVKENGKIKQVIGVVFDTTESRETEEARRKDEFRYRQLFNSANDAIFMMGNQTFVDCNEATLKIFDCQYDQIVGQTPYRYSPPFQKDGRTSEEAAMEKINAALDGKPQFFEWLHIRHDGTPFDAEVSLNRLDLGEEVYIQAIVRDISARKKAEAENKRLALVANHTTNMVVVADKNGLIEWVNPAFTEVTGYTLEEATGKSPGNLLRGKDSDPEVRSQMRNRIQAGQGFKDLETINYTKKGDPYWVSIEVQPILDQNEKVVQFIAIESDITERKMTQQALMERHEDLIRINEELDRFVYSASHDLRAPISSLLGLIELARLEKDVANIIPLLEMQKKSLLQMDHFIKDIVDYSRNTRSQIESVSIDFTKMVNDIVEQLQFMENVNLITKEIVIEQSESFYTSATRLNIILNNLISNAIKYADFDKQESFIKVNVKVNKNEAVIQVKDNGEGIPLETESKIFEMFYRASEKSSGSGLGLYIVKGAVEKLGGTINVESKQLEGSAFTVVIPNMLN